MTERRRRKIACYSCRYPGYALDEHVGYKWWMIPAGLAIALTGIGLLPLAIIVVVMANCTKKVCPKCRDDDFDPWDGSPSDQSMKIWHRACWNDEKAFKRQKLIIFAVVMVMLVAAVIFAYVAMQ